MTPVTPTTQENASMSNSHLRDHLGVSARDVPLQGMRTGGRVTDEVSFWMEIRRGLRTQLDAIDGRLRALGAAPKEK